MARISYDAPTAAAFRAARELPREGLSEWREAVRRHLRQSPGLTLVDVGPGTGAFAAAFSDWFDLEVVAVEPSAAMREQIPPAIRAFEEMRAPCRCRTDRPTPRGSRSSCTTSRISKRPRTSSAAWSARVHPS
jgi:hypothetical protein